MPNSFKIARIGGIDININWTWLIVFAVFTWSLGGGLYQQHFHSWGIGISYLVGGISALLLFVTVLLHELAHSFTARARGLPVHSITLHIFGGVSNLTREPDDPQTELLVTMAGPLTSLLLSGLFFALWELAPGLPSEVSAILGYLASVNLILAIFNLIPGFPLDGGRVLRATVWWITGNLRRATRVATITGNIIGYLFILAGLLDATVGGNVVGGVWLAFIGWFLHNAAGASYQQVALGQLLQGVDVRQVMDPAPLPAYSHMIIGDVLNFHMLEANQRAVPVAGPDGALVGLLTLADVRKVPRSDWGKVPISRIMRTLDQLHTVSPDDDLQSALRVLAENGYHQVPVMQDGKLVGFLNRAHVLQYLHVREALARNTADHDDEAAAPPAHHVS